MLVSRNCQHFTDEETEARRSIIYPRPQSQRVPREQEFSPQAMLPPWDSAPETSTQMASIKQAMLFGFISSASCDSI